MKKLIVLFAFVMGLAFMASPAMAGDGEGQLSVMTLTVKKAKSPAQAEKLKSQLLALAGVKAVETNGETVVVRYNKSELGCCSRIHSALETNKVKYSLVSNEERPACTNHNHGGGNGSHCTKKKES
jgi:hypothetical protein